MDPETIWHAIIDQESGGNFPNPGQIQPQTFSQYAQPGERIDNPVDNVNVSKRIINDYFKKYNGDVGKIATAYFSGPGNVSNGPQPFIRNSNDGTKTTASYVSDIQRRVARMAQPDNSNFDADKAFSQFEKAAKPVQESFDPSKAFSQWEASPANVPLPTPRPNIPQPEAAKPTYDAGLGYENQLIEGMPIIGPLTNKLIAATGATIQPYLDKNSAPTFGERYSKNLADIESGNKKFSESHPVGSTIANLTGGGLLAGPVASTNLGGTLLGTYGPTLASRIYTGAAGGAGIGAIDALLRGEDPTTGAYVGGAGGAAGPVVGEAAKGVTHLVSDAVNPPSGPLNGLLRGTVSRLASAFDGETPQTIAAAKDRMGPAGLLGQLTQGTSDIMTGTANRVGPHKAVVREAINQQADTQGSRIDKALTDAMGPKVDIEQFKNFTSEAKKAAADPLYEEWRSMQVQPTPELKALMPTLDKLGLTKDAEEHALMRGVPFDKNFFTPGQQKNYPTTESWDMIKRAIDSRIDTAYSSGDKTKAADLITLKNRMIDEIEKTPAGQVWNQARSEFADRASIEEQIQAGQDTFLGGRSGINADKLRAELKGLNGPELSARIVGMRNAVGEAMGASSRGDTTLRNKLLAPNNQDKIRLLIGDQRADNLIKTLEQESYLSNRRTEAVGNSTTVPKGEAVKALDIAPLPRYGFNLSNPATFIPPAFRPTNVLEAWRGLGNENVVNQLGRIVSQPAGPTVDQLVDAVHRESLRRAAVSHVAQGRSSLLTSLIAAPGATTVRRRQYAQ